MPLLLVWNHGRSGFNMGYFDGELVLFPEEGIVPMGVPANAHSAGVLSAANGAQTHTLAAGGPNLHGKPGAGTGIIPELFQNFHFRGTKRAALVAARQGKHKMLLCAKTEGGFSAKNFRDLPLFRRESCDIMTVTDEI